MPKALASVRVVNEKEREHLALKAPRGLGLGRGITLASGEGFGKGAFWCILGTRFNISIRRVKQSRKAVLCANCQLASYRTQWTYHP